MKFAYIAVALATVASALADTVPLSGDCKKAFATFEECGNTQAAKMDDFVKVYQSEKCQNLYKDPIAALEKCGELDAETKDKLIADVKFSQAYNVLYTAKSEDGKPCPLYRNNNIEKVKDTCASKACTEASVEAYKLLAEGKKLNKNDVTVYENILKALQDCDKTVAENGNNGNSTVADGNNAVNGTANAANSTATNSTNSTQANVNNVTSGASEMMKYTMAAVFAAVYLLF